jgi:hypothetical protein
MKKRLFVILGVLVTVISIIACGTLPIPTPTLYPPQPTLTSLPTQTSYPSLPTLTPLPTQTQYPPLPTLTQYPPLPTLTPMPTQKAYTPLPTLTPRPTNTSYPPRPTLTPRPTQTQYPPLPTLTPRPTNTLYPTQTPYPKLTLCTGAGVSVYREKIQPILDQFTALNRNQDGDILVLNNTDSLIQAKKLLKATQALTPPPLLIVFHLFLINREEAFIDWLTSQGYPPIDSVSTLTPPVINVTVPDFTGDVRIEWNLVNIYCQWPVPL